MELIHLLIVIRPYPVATEYRVVQSAIPHEQILAVDHLSNNTTQVAQV